MKIRKGIFLLGIFFALTNSKSSWCQKVFNEEFDYPSQSEKVESIPTLGSGVWARFVSDSIAVFRLRPGDGDGRILVVREGAPVSVDLNNPSGYNSNPNFGEGEDLGNNTFVLNISTDLNYFDTVILNPGKLYHFKSWEYNEVDGEFYYLDEPHPLYANEGSVVTPNKGALLFGMDSVITTSFLEFYPQFGAADYVFIDPANPQRYVTFYPQSEGSRINISFNRFGLPEEFNYFIFNGTSDSDSLLATKSNISSGSVFTATNDLGALTVKFEYTGTDYTAYNGYGAWVAEVYETGNEGIGPTLPVSNFHLNSIGVDDASMQWDAGNEEGVLVLMSKNPIAYVPETGVTYTADSVFGQGTDVGNETFVVKASAGNSLDVTGLETEGPYYVAVYGFLEDEGTGERYYNTSRFISDEFTFVKGPEWEGELYYRTLTNRSVTLFWDPGDADGTLITFGGAPVTDQVYYEPDILPDSNYLSFNSHYYWFVEDSTAVISPFRSNYALRSLTIHPFRETAHGINYGDPVSIGEVFTTTLEPPTEPGVIHVVAKDRESIEVSMEWNRGSFFLVAALDTIPALEQKVTIEESSLIFGVNRSDKYPRTSILYGPSPVGNSGDTVIVSNLQPGLTYTFGAIPSITDQIKQEVYYYDQADAYYQIKLDNDVLEVDPKSSQADVWCAGETFGVDFIKSVATPTTRSIVMELQGGDGQYDTLGRSVFEGTMTERTPFGSGSLTVPDLPTDTYNFRWWLTGKDDSTYSPAYPVELIFIEEPEITTSGTTLASSVAGDSVQWFFNEEYSASGTSLPNGNRAGIYSVRVYQDGCYRDSEPLVVTGLEDEFSVAGLVAYPNPTSGELRMQLPSAIGDQRVTVTVLTPQGRTALKATNHPASAPLRVDHLRTGMYYLHVEGTQYHSSTAFYKE